MLSVFESNIIDWYNKKQRQYDIDMKKEQNLPWYKRTREISTKTVPASIGGLLGLTYGKMASDYIGDENNIIPLVLSPLMFSAGLYYGNRDFNRRISKTNSK